MPKNLCFVVPNKLLTVKGTKTVSSAPIRVYVCDDSEKEALAKVISTRFKDVTTFTVSADKGK